MVHKIDNECDAAGDETPSAVAVVPSCSLLQADDVEVGRSRIHISTRLKRTPLDCLPMLPQTYQVEGTLMPPHCSVPLPRTRFR